MTAIVLAFHAFVALVSPLTLELANAARATSPTYLTPETAIVHAQAAIIAAGVYDVPAPLLLSIAWHESRYAIETVTPLGDGSAKTSCGVMTPEPTQGSCRSATSSALAGYLAGARHLHGWITAAHGNLPTALLGYAGGWRLIRLCKTRDVAACHTPDVFLRRAAWILRETAS
jgi:hypothetical protein